MDIDVAWARHEFWRLLGEEADRLGVVAPDCLVVIKDERDQLEKVTPTVHFLGSIGKGKQLGLSTGRCNHTLLRGLTVDGPTKE